MKEKFYAAIVMAMIIALATACNTERRFNDYAVKNQDKFKKLAAILAPCFESGIVRSDTLIQTKSDTVYSAGETIIERRHDTVTITKQLPGKTITNTKTVTIRDTVPDTRRIDALTLEISQLKEKAIVCDDEKQNALKTAKNRLWWIIGLSVAFVASIVSKLVNFWGWVKGVFKV